MVSTHLPHLGTVPEIYETNGPGFRDTNPHYFTTNPSKIISLHPSRLTGLSITLVRVIAVGGIYSLSKLTIRENQKNFF